MSISIDAAISRFQDFYKEKGRVPSYSEVSEMFGFASKNSSYKLVQKLIKEGVLTKDSTGKIKRGKLLEIPHPELTKQRITASDLKKILDELLIATHDLAESHPAPSNDKDKFLRVLEGTYRRATFTNMAISALAQNIAYADSAADLVRKVIEDTISIEYMIAKGKQEMAERFQEFMWMQLHQNKEFLLKTGANFEALGLADKSKEMEEQYKEVRPKFIHRGTKKDLRSWIGNDAKDVEDMLEQLHKMEEAKLTDFDVSRTVIGYVRACWKNHFNPYDVNAYMSNDLLEASTQEALNHALIFAVTCHYRLTTRYIDQIREATKDNNQLEDVHLSVDKIWEKLNSK